MQSSRDTAIQWHSKEIPVVQETEMAERVVQGGGGITGALERVASLPIVVQ